MAPFLSLAFEKKQIFSVISSHKKTKKNAGDAESKSNLWMSLRQN